MLNLARNRPPLGTLPAGDGGGEGAAGALDEGRSVAHRVSKCRVAIFAEVRTPEQPEPAHVAGEVQLVVDRRRTALDAERMVDAIEEVIVLRLHVTPSVSF